MGREREREKGNDGMGSTEGRGGERKGKERISKKGKEEVCKWRRGENMERQGRLRE